MTLFSLDTIKEYWYLNQVYDSLCHHSNIWQLLRMKARSSVGERHLDVVDVGGSIPPAPTRKKAEGVIPYKGVNTLAFVFIY